MNKSIQYLYLLLALLVLLATSCKKHEEPEALAFDLPTDLVTFTQAGGMLEVAVLTTDNQWTLEQGPKSDWLKAEKIKEGIKLTAEENQTGENRETSISVTLQGIHKVIKVKQDATIRELQVDKTEHTFGSEGGELQIPVLANSSDWTYSISGSTPWLTIEKSSDNKSLKVKAERSFDPNPREVYIAISYGENAIIHIRQVGVRLFPEFKLTIGMTRTDVEAFAKEAGLVEDTDIIKYGKFNDNWDWVPADMTRNEAANGSALFYVTEALKGKYLVYQFKNNDKSKVFAVHIIAKEGEKYDIADISGYFKGMGYFNGGIDMKGRNVWQKNDVQALKSYKAYLYLEPGQNTSIPKYYPKGGCITFELPTEINPDDVGNIMTEFPMDRLDTFFKPSIQFDQVKEYELSRGFKMMSGDDSTKKSDVEGYKYLYEFVQFQVADIDSAKDGDLVSTMYFFLIPGMKNYGKEYNEMAKPENAGSIGQRIDLYKGYKKFFDRTPFGYWSLKADVIEFAKQKGYELATTDRKEYGRTYFTKGDDIIFIEPRISSVQVQFFRNKDIAELARNNKRPDNQ